MDEMHLLLREEQTAAYTVEIWKRFRKWGGIPTGITQNVKDLLASKEVENIFENSDFIYMLNQAVGDRAILAKQLNISPHQLSYVTHSGEGEGLLFYGNVILPFVDRFPTDIELYHIMTTKLSEITEAKEEEKPESDGIDIEPKAQIIFEDFEKLQFQVGEIIACEEVKKSKKLLCSQVKIGSQVKQIVSGIKAHYSAEEMVGKKVMVLVNLKPAKLAGILSEGMLLCAEDENGELALMIPEKNMPAGAEIC